MRRWSPTLGFAFAFALALACGCRSEARRRAVASDPTASAGEPREAADATSSARLEPRPAPSHEERRAPATRDCEAEHEERAWMPRQTVKRASRTTPCLAFADCAPLAPESTRLAGCEDVGSRCRPVLVTPKLVNASTASARRVQELLDAEIAEYRSVPNDCWLGALDYTIHYNEHGILDVTVRASGSGAYPDTHARHVALDLARGEKLGASAFLAEKHEALARLVHEKLARALRSVDPKMLWNDEVRAFTPENLGDFMVTREGVVFLYDFGVAHAVRAHTPLSEYLLRWSVVRPFIDAKGPLGRVQR